MRRRPPRSTLFPYTTRFRSSASRPWTMARPTISLLGRQQSFRHHTRVDWPEIGKAPLRAPCEVTRSEEHTSELQSRYLVCRLLLEKKQTAPLKTARHLPCAT